MPTDHFKHSAKEDVPDQGRGYPQRRSTSMMHKREIERLSARVAIAGA